MPDRAVYLILKAEGLADLRFLIPDSFEDGYTNKLKAVEGIKTTLPVGYEYSGGSLSDLPITVELVAGVSYGIDTPAELAVHVQRLFDMALPPANAVYLTPVTVIITGGSVGWFSRKGFFQSLKVKWSNPVDVTSGRPLRATVSMVFKPTQAPRTDVATPTSALLKRPFKFNMAPGG